MLWFSLSARLFSASRRPLARPLTHSVRSAAPSASQPHSAHAWIRSYVRWLRLLRLSPFASSSPRYGLVLRHGKRLGSPTCDFGQHTHQHHASGFSSFSRNTPRAFTAQGRSESGWSSSTGSVSPLSYTRTPLPGWPFRGPVGYSRGLAHSSMSVYERSLTASLYDRTGVPVSEVDSDWAQRLTDTLRDAAPLQHPYRKPEDHVDASKIQLPSRLPRAMGMVFYSYVAAWVRVFCCPMLVYVRCRVS